MIDGSLIPISDEQAKLGQEIVGAGRDIGGYLAGILGDLPKDLVGLLIGNRVKVRRAERLAELWHKAQERLRNQGIGEPEPPSLKIALPILAAAADETREEIQDLWMRLLAASMHPDQSKLVRLGFAEAVQRLDPLDARAMIMMRDTGGGVSQGDRNAMASRLDVTRDEVDVSLRNLVKVELAFEVNQSMTALTPFGREFLRCVGR
jgi:hypothetical protein